MNGHDHNQAGTAEEAGRRLAAFARLPDWFIEAFPTHQPTPRERFMAWLRGKVSS